MKYDELLTMVMDSDPESDWIGESLYDESVRVFKGDVNLRFEVKYTGDGVQCEDFREPWANKHPDSSATGYYFSLYYGSSLIERFILVSVDGGRAKLPIPTEGPTSVTPLYYKVAQIHDTVRTLDQYMKRSGLTVVP